MDKKLREAVEANLVEAINDAQESIISTIDEVLVVHNGIKNAVPSYYDWCNMSHKIWNELEALLEPEGDSNE